MIKYKDGESGKVVERVLDDVSSAAEASAIRVGRMAPLTGAIPRDAADIRGGEGPELPHLLHPVVGADYHTDSRGDYHIETLWHKFRNGTDRYGQVRKDSKVNTSILM